MARPLLLLGTLIEQFRLPQIELPLDSPARNIGQDATSILLVDMPALGADQQKLDLVVQVAEVPVAVVKIAATLDVFQPMALTDPYRPKDCFREIARGRGGAGSSRLIRGNSQRGR